MLEKRRKEIINMILEHAAALTEMYDDNEVYNIAYRGIDKIKETYSLDELESLYIETFKEYEELELRYAKRSFISKIEDYTNELREYPNIDIDALEEYKYKAIVLIDECPFKKSLVSLYLDQITRFEELKVTDLHRHYYDLIDVYAANYDLNNEGIALSVRIAKEKISMTAGVRNMNAIYDEFVASVGKEFICIDDVRVYYKRELLEYGKSIMNLSNAQTVMLVVDEAFKIIESMNTTEDLSELYRQTTGLLSEYDSREKGNDIKRA